MKINGYPTAWNDHEGLQPIDIQDIQLMANPEELEKISQFLSDCAEKIKEKQNKTFSIELGDSKKGSKTGISIMVISNKNEL